MHSGMPTTRNKLVIGSGVMATDWYRYFQDTHNAAGFAGTKYPLYEDLCVPALQMRVGTGTSPTLTVINTTNVGYVFADGVDAELFFHVVLPHGYIEKSNLRPWVQWMPQTSGAGSVVWRIDYSWVAIGETMPTDAAISVTSSAPGVAYRHTYAEYTRDIVGGLSASVEKKFSSVLMCRVSRVGTDGQDTYGAGAVLIAAGIHFMNAAHGTPTRWPSV